MGCGEEPCLSTVEDRLRYVQIIEDSSKSWVMMASPVPMALILLLYGLMLIAGPRLMKYRDPCDVKNAMRIYNLLQVAHNTYMFLSIFFNPRAIPFILAGTCSTVGPEDETYALLYEKFVYYTWHYMVSKHIDLIDTVFMVLRKKNSHITFLHVYHHMAMVFFTWFTLNGKTATLHVVIPGVINVVVHSIMYSYYFLATFNRFKRFLWWKQHLTKLQLGQFVVILLYICLIYYHECPISRSFTITWTFNVFVILVLFLNFYYKAYLTKTEESVKRSAKDRDKKSS